MARITEELLRHIRIEGGNIIYNKPVTKIEFNDDRAYCYTTQYCFKCSIVVIAVPPPEISYIHIEPPLPQNASRSQTLYLQSDNIFFNVFYKEPFWNNEYSGDVLATPESNTILNVAYDATCDNEEQGVIAGFLNNTNVTSTTSKLLLFETLSRCFQTNEAKRWINYKECERVLEREDVIIQSECGWPMSVMQPCHISDHVNHINASTDRTLFAASEYATKWPGTVDGAIETGELVACLVLLKVRPQTLNLADMIAISSLDTVRHSFFIGIAIMQCFCLAMNTAILFSLLRVAYSK
ncbi:hypothetical protein KPH14_011955 [Odynerus spinipes]|uniref:monoamine oxidase n=1 Tax=Odynerus spinipes TaxID=1348599 RepID=A0AAD9VJK6_9HYME|nr:hypothetical protein KPH14_011955 [Odynerus spinipes]